MNYKYKNAVKDFKQFVNESYGEEMEEMEMGEIETPEELKVYGRQEEPLSRDLGVGGEIVITPDDYWTPEDSVIGGGLDIPIDQSEEGGAPPLTPNDIPIEID